MMIFVGRSVALLVSAWIEMLLPRLQPLGAIVALLVSAWIEIVTTSLLDVKEQSHSS